MSSTKICQFSQKDLKSSTCDVFGPNRGGVLSFLWQAMNWCDKNFWNWLETLLLRIEANKQGSEYREQLSNACCRRLCTRHLFDAGVDTSDLTRSLQQIWTTVLRGTPFTGVYGGRGEGSPPERGDLLPSYGSVKKDSNKVIDFLPTGKQFKG